MSDVLVATTSFSTEVNGYPESIIKGVTRIRSSHPIARQNPEYFAPVDNGVVFEMVEEAVAPPAVKRGEQKRGPGRPKKSTGQ